MVRISQHKQQQHKELKEANIKVKLHKYIFSPEFASMLYEFSEEHHSDHFKVFNKALEEWSQQHKDIIAAEIERSDMDPENIYDKIKISARFYYRKKSKKEKKEVPKKKKPYIGLSQQFIITMDEFIKIELLNNEIANQKRKTTFAIFTQTHIQQIKDELKVLRQKYDEANTDYEPKEISKKIKKAFDNRFYIFTGEL